MREKASKEPNVTVYELSCSSECWRVAGSEMRSPPGREAWRAERNHLVTLSLLQTFNSLGRCKKYLLFKLNNVFTRGIHDFFFFEAG